MIFDNAKVAVKKKALGFMLNPKQHTRLLVLIMLFKCTFVTLTAVTKKVH